MEQYIRQCGLTNSNELQKAVEKNGYWWLRQLPSFNENYYGHLKLVAKFGFTLSEARELIIKAKDVGEGSKNVNLP